MKVKAIKEFSVSLFDDDGAIVENEFYDVSCGEVYEVAYETPEGIVRLDSETGWLEISRDHLAECFEVISDARD
ncbi:MAG: hypothetical protein LKE37_05090 [Atopobiaceae bacterium]|jgi:hypothetical protein|nr:hypothetical protein [Atopobiaceae bacterium]